MKQTKENLTTKVYGLFYDCTFPYEQSYELDSLYSILSNAEAKAKEFNLGLRAGSYTRYVVEEIELITGLEKC